MMPDHEESTPLRVAVDKHLKALGLQQSDLAQKLEVSASTISSWLGGRRQPSQEDLSEIVFALASEYERKPNRSRQRHEFGSRGVHILMHELWVAAGFSRGTDRALQRLSERNKAPLRIGLFEWVPLVNVVAPLQRAEVRPRTNDEPHLQGLAVDLSKAVAALMGFNNVKIEMLEWPGLRTQILSDRVDLIGPVYLRVPMRMRDLRLSQPVPNFEVTVNGLVHRDHRNQIFRKVVAGSDQHAVREVDSQRVALVVGEGEVDALLGSLTVPGAMLDQSNTFGSLKAGWESLISNPTLTVEGNTLVRVFPTDQLTCDVAQQLSEGTIVPIFESGEGFDENSLPALGLCFVAHQAEKRLIRMVDAALEELGRNSRYLFSLFARHGLTKFARDRAGIASSVRARGREGKSMEASTIEHRSSDDEGILR